MEINLLIALVLFGCLALSFILSGMEAGVFALSRLRIRQQMRAGNAAARVLHQFLEKPENFLWTIVVGNTLLNFVVLGWLFSALYGYGQVPLRSGWFGLWFLVAVVVFYTLFDLLPKMLFRVYPTRLCLFLARPFRVLHIGLRPLVAVVEWCAQLLLRWSDGRKFSGHLFGNREELREAMQESAQVFTSEERQMVTRVLDLENVTVRQIAKPFAQVMTISETATVADALKLFRASGYTRLPVWQQREGGRRIAGLISAESLMFNAELGTTRPVAELIAPGLFLAEDSRLDAALERMQRGGQRLAVVLGRDGREVGLVGLEDILKTIFGEVQL
jgi:CBS domain containing-hemolysin-like protein